MHILSPETDNCPSWIRGMERMTVENISWSISTKVDGCWYLVGLHGGGNCNTGRKPLTLYGRPPLCHKPVPGIEPGPQQWQANDLPQPASVAQLDAPSDWRPGGRGFNPRRGRQHSFVEIDHEIFSTVILSLPLIQEGQLSVSGERMCTILVNRLED